MVALDQHRGAKGVVQGKLKRGAEKRPHFILSAAHSPKMTLMLDFSLTKPEKNLKSNY